MIVVIWNVRNSLAAWEYLVNELRPDLALVQEFTPRPRDACVGRSSTPPYSSSASRHRDPPDGTERLALRHRVGVR